MGTSSSYNGFKNNSSLLPRDFINTINSNIELALNEPNQDTDLVLNEPNEDIDLTSDEPINTIMPWKTVKLKISILPSKDTDNPDFNKIRNNGLSSYIKAHKGAKKISKTIKSGKKTAKKLFVFFNSIQRDGIEKSFKDYNISYLGKSITEVLNSIIITLSPSPNTKEDAIAKKAMINSIAYICDYFFKNNENLENLEQLNSENLSQLITVYISSYIFEKFLSEMESRFEKYANEDVEKIIKIENNIKEYISQVVKYQISKTNIDSIENIESFIDDLYTDCYSVIEQEV